MIIKWKIPQMMTIMKIEMQDMISCDKLIINANIKSKQKMVQ